MNETRVRRHRTGRMVEMSSGPQPEEIYTVYVGGRVVGSGLTNCSFFCCPEPLGTGRGLAATDDQIIFAITHDESIFG